MNSALRKYDAMFIIPVLQALWLLFGVLGGGIFFKEFDSLTSLQFFFFSLGVLILLIGVSILSPKVTSGGVEALEGPSLCFFYFILIIIYFIFIVLLRFYVILFYFCLKLNIIFFN